jgi:SAM-dependent methyltransferase
MQYVKFLSKKITSKIYRKVMARYGSASYWTSHMVSNDDWINAEASMDHFHWRNVQYPGYIELMPVNYADGLTVVDYGCGPGHDLVGFSEFSKPSRLIGVDVSPTALEVSKSRLALHGKSSELIKINEKDNILPLESDEVDLVHSSGVLHHAKNLELAINEIWRILKPGGKFQVMVYNYDSLWLHLYTAYIHQIKLGRYSNMPVLEAFRHTTDGPDCPISHCYRPNEFVEKIKKFGFSGSFKGASMSLTEMEILPKRFAAMSNRSLDIEHRDFLAALEFNHLGQPTINGSIAGINACFEFTKK